MDSYKKYRTIHRIAYISFFIYLLILAVSDINFGLKNGEIPYHILIPFALYCIIAVGMEVVIRKERKSNRKPENKDEINPKLSGI